MEHSSAAALFLVLAIILLAARLGGSLARRFGQPRVLGELLVGIVLGPTLLNLLHSQAFGLADAHLDDIIHLLAELGVLLLMFIVGLEVHLEDLLKVGRVAVIAGVIGALAPVLFTIPLMALFGYSWQAELFTGVALAATSVSISAQVLLELGLLKSKVGSALLAAALVDDVIAILLVSLTTAVTSGNGTVESGELLSIIARMSLFLGIAFVLAWYGLPRLLKWIGRTPLLSASYGLPVIALATALLFGWAAQELGGVAAITGAFIAGIGMSNLHPNEKHAIEGAAGNLAYALLVPVFFISVGLQTDLRQFPLSALPLTLGLLIVAVASKVIGSGLGAYWGGFNKQEAYQLGVAMISRGEVGLIIFALGISRGIFVAGDALASSLFLVIILTTLITPLWVRRVFAPEKAA